jgi:hypothetical protein
MMKKLLFAVLFTVGCSTTGTSSSDYTITGDECRLYNDVTSCDAHSPCTWIAADAPCQQGSTCLPAGVCVSPDSGGGSGSGSGSGGGSGSGSGSGSGGGSGSGSGSGSGGGSGSGSATGCACANGGICYEQIGGPAQQAGSEPDIQCFAASSCDGITGQGHCSPDPNVTGLCLCDDGIR